MTHISIQRLMGACALALASLLSACGGASSTVDPVCGTQVSPTIPGSRVIAFGDAYSDVGQQAGKRYTVNDGLGTGTVAERLAFNCGFTTAMTPVKTGPIVGPAAYSYAEGNALIKSTTDVAGLTTAAGGATSVTDQVENFLASNTPGAHDLIIVTAGTRDVLLNAKRYFDDPTNFPQSTAIANVQQAAQDLVVALKRLTDSGAKHVVVMSPGNLARTPWGQSFGGNYQSGFSTQYRFLEKLSVTPVGDTSCSAFSCQLSNKLGQPENYPASTYVDKRPVLWADIGGFYNLMTGTVSTGSINSYLTYAPGISNPQTPVCNTASSLNSELGLGYGAGQLNSLTCVPPLGIATNSSTALPWDYATSLFADDINLTPAGNRLLADQIYTNSFYRAAWR